MGTTGTAKLKVVEKENVKRPEVQLLDPSNRGDQANEMESYLLQRVIGQREAVTAMVDVYQSYLAGLNDRKRPVASLILLGPTGTGKTLLCETVAQYFSGDPRNLIKVDCGEFQHSHEVAKLVGSPPGYLGHRETQPMLSQERLQAAWTEKNKLSFVLFDEIEKASDALRKLLLGILDKATLTLGDNRRVDFSSTVVFMTSNLGAEEAVKMAGNESLGFHNAGTQANRISGASMAALRKRFETEFVNRIDRNIVFHPLSAADMDQIVNLELGKFQSRVFDSTAPFIMIPMPAIKAKLSEGGFNPRYGARGLKREVVQLIEQPIARLIASRSIRAGDSVEVDYEDGNVTFKRIGTSAMDAAYLDTLKKAIA